MKITIGTRVTCVLHYFGEGIVYDVAGVPAPATVRELAGGVVTTGGNARYSVVFANGAVARDVSEAVILGVQWSIREGVADAEEIAAALANAACVKASKASAEQMKAVRIAAEVAALKADPAHSKLVQGEDFYSGKLAAKNIRQELKAAFPGVKFSVTKRDYGAVSVKWTDGPTVDQVNAITGKYKSGYYDPHEDLHSNKVGPWHMVFGGVDYLNTGRDYSASHLQKAIDALFDENGALDEIEKPTPETYGRGYVVVPGSNSCLSELVLMQARKMEGQTK